MSNKPIIQYNLPVQPTPFIGRIDDINEVMSLLANKDCRLVTLVGAGGMGKTRLAIKVAELILEGSQDSFNFYDGIYFTPLQPLNSPDFLITAIADAIGMSVQGQVEPQDQLLRFLKDKHSLLIMDNFEHLLDGARVVDEILQVAPDVKIIVTSREALNLKQEWVRPVRGMSLPDNVLVADDIENYSALKLFIECARRVRAGYDDIEQAIQICRLVGGIPLAIELSASWLKTLSAGQIVHEIQQSLDILSTNMRNVPDRHRSIRAVFEQSWHRLSPQEQDALKQLTVFQGQFSPEAGKFISDISVFGLSTLVEKSLLRFNAEGLYEMHALLRQFAGEKLSESPEIETKTRDLHAEYYANYLHQLEPSLRGAQPQVVCESIEKEINNIRVAWQYAVRENKIEVLNLAEGCLALFYRTRSRIHEAIQVFELADRYCSDDDLVLLLKVRFMLARFITEGRDFNAGIVLAQRTFEQWKIHGVPGEAVFELTQVCIAITSSDDADHELNHASYRVFNDNLETCQENGDRWGEGMSLYCLAELAHATGDLETAVQYAKKSIEIFQEDGSTWALAFPVGTYERLMITVRNYSEAKKTIRRRLELLEASGDSQGMNASYVRRADIALAEEEYDVARDYLVKSLKIMSTLQSYVWLPTVIHLSARLFFFHHDMVRTIELITAADVIFDRIHHMPKNRLVSHQLDVTLLNRIQAEVSHEVFASAKQGGTSLAERLIIIDETQSFAEELLDEILSISLMAEDSVRQHEHPLVDALSERELEVLNLIADGLSNREVASQLFISIGTVKSHAHNIYSKLDAQSRTQAVARAKSLGLI